MACRHRACAIRTLALLTVAVAAHHAEAVQASTSAQSQRTVCYYTSWCQYTSGKGQFLPSNLDPMLCTHILYAFAGINSKHQLTWAEASEDIPTLAGIQKAVENTATKVMLSVGGGGFPVSKFSTMAKTATRRSTFIASAISLLRKHNLQGLDIDWEMPGFDANFEPQPSLAGEKAKFAALLTETAAAFAADAAKTGRPRLQLSIAAGAENYVRHQAYNVPAINKAVDFINLMTYDYAGPGWMKTTGINAPLNGSAHIGHYGGFVSHDVKAWIAAGAAPSKIVMGVPAYADTWTLANANKHHGLGAAATGPGPGGPYTKDAGSLAYYEVVALPNAKKHHVASAEASYIVSGSTWVTSEDLTSAALKGAFIKAHGLGGAMFWELSQDAFQNKAYPLIRAVKSAMS